VVVRDFDVVGIGGIPPEADSVLRIDADTVLPKPITGHPLQSVRRRGRQILHANSMVQLVQLASRDRPQR
jgi:hypothetical protein